MGKIKFDFLSRQRKLSDENRIRKHGHGSGAGRDGAWLAAVA